MLDAAVSGQGFPAPTFSGEFEVASQALVKEKHLKLSLLRGSAAFQRDLVQSRRSAAAARDRSRTGSSAIRGTASRGCRLIVEHAG